MRPGGKKIDEYVLREALGRRRNFVLALIKILGKSYALTKRSGRNLIELL